MLFRYSCLFGGIVLLLGIAITTGSSLPPSQQWAVLIDFMTTPVFEPQSFEQILFVEAQLPRLAISICIGAVLGLVGSLLQQLTQNPMVSPLTLGTTSGAWLALVVAGVWAPSFAAQYGSLIPFVGALVSLTLVVLIVGFKNLSGLPVILAGMSVNILFGALATSIILLNDQFARDLFIWGAGDLAQNGWQAVTQLLPHLLIALPIILFAPRVLALLRLGHNTAKARGLSLVPAFLLLFVAALWLLSAAISHVGVISFIGLIAPNIARSLGARTPSAELRLSALMGALLLLSTDTLAQNLSFVSINIIPTGTATALIGAPILIWLVRKRLTANDQLSLKLPASQMKFGTQTLVAMVVLVVMAIVLHLFVAGDTWRFAMPDAFNWAQRWPRLLTALSAGFGLAIAGTVLQRIIYNPLASPDILGVSSGASLFLVIGFLIYGTNSNVFSMGLAFTGSLAVLIALLWLVKRNNYAPSIVILTGISLSALVDSLIQFVLAQGNETSYMLLTWLSGSTYRVSGDSALFLCACVLILSCLILGLHRWLTLISGGRRFASSRGLNVPLSFALLLVLSALLTALVTATMGPVAFVGLLAPHIAVMIGARKSHQQLIVAGLAGSALLAFADWVGQVAIYPSQIAAGTLVSVIGGVYFLILLLRARQH